MKLDPAIKQAVLSSLVAPKSGFPVDIRIDGTIGKQIADMGDKVTAAIKAIPRTDVPAFPKPVDNAADFKAIAGAIKSLRSADVEGAAKIIAGAVSQIRVDATDLSAIVEAIQANTMALRDVLKELRKPRTIKTDGDGIPTRIE